LEGRPTSRFYAGFIGHIDPLDLSSPSFASGSGYFLTRDLVKMLTDNPEAFACHQADDVALGIFFASKGIGITPGRRQDDETFGKDLRCLDKSQYHYHFRNNPQIMYEIHKRTGK
jgi:hypothetical protein